MPQVTHASIWYPNGYPGTAYDLTKVTMYADDPDNATLVRVWFRHQSPVVCSFNKADFLAALALVP